MKVFNSLTRELEGFTPIDPPNVRMYTCGPTVYQRAHIGNLRSFVCADLLHRALKNEGYDIQRVMNITDVGHLTNDSDTGDDKIEQAARTQKKSVGEITRSYTDAFFDDLDRLGVDRTGITFTRATEHIPQQIELIKKLEKAGVTYAISDGIYLGTTQLDAYPKLGTIDPEQLKPGARVEDNEEKRAPGDFALWKFSPKGEQRLQEWDSPWGVGFPGWHLECSAMATEYLGATIDIHTGGVDLQFPHHANEIAQCETANKVPFARYWLHSEHVQLSGEKMSKSTGNIVTLDNLAEHGVSPMAYRYWLCTAHYRSQISFDEETARGSRTALQRLQSIRNDLPSGGTPTPAVRDRIDTAMANDLDTPTVIATIWETVHNTQIVDTEKRAVIDYGLDLLGINLSEFDQRSLSIDELPVEVLDLLQERDAARSDKNYSRADEIRNVIREEHGLELKDTSDGPRIYRAS